MATPIASPNITIDAEPLTPAVFAPFGTVITPPLPPTTTTIPSSPLPNGSTLANQGTALKFSDISPLTSTYHLSPSGAPSRPAMSLFACFPRTLRTFNGRQIFDVRVLERHPFTTQTFIPISPVSTSKCVIVVAPTLPSPPPASTLTPYFPQSKQGGLPDLKNMKAFLTEPGTGVTYGVGTWHAPMVVVDGRVDFAVTQFVSKRDEEDCQEVELKEGMRVVLERPNGGAKL